MEIVVMLVRGRIWVLIIVDFFLMYEGGLFVILY